jgi:endoglucanase
MRRIRFWLLSVCCTVLCIVGCAQMQATSVPIFRFETPFLYAYGSWENQVTVEGGRALLRGDGVTGQGGAGISASLNLNRYARDYSPALRLKVGDGNEVPALVMILRDEDHGAVYEFPLPEPSGDFVLVTPLDGAPLAQPNKVDKGMPDLAALTQVQIQGNWDNGSLNVEVQTVEVVPPDAALRAARAAQAERQQESTQGQQREQADLRDRYGQRNALSPNVEHVSLVAPDVLALTFQAGQVVPSSLTQYSPQPGDEQVEQKGEDGRVQQVILKRQGEEVGWLIGPQRDQLVTYETLQGDPLLSFIADEAATYRITSRDDSAFARGVQPSEVYRKSKPTDWAQPGRGFAMRHIVYLKLPHPLKAGRHYAVNLGDLNANPGVVNFTHDPSRVRSEAVHATQIGYRPDDPVKRAFLSVWLGTGGAYAYPANLKFHLINEVTNRIEYSGTVAIAKRADEIEQMWRDDNFNKTDVYRMDFGDFKTPGRYRVSVDGIGCSYPFEIGPDVWQHAFEIQMRGLYHQRSGIALGPPYTDFVKPRDFYPAEGAEVYQSTHSALDGGPDGEQLDKKRTDRLVPEAWGGYHDAGDWNPRRVTHLRVTMAQLEVMQLFPQYFSGLKLHIPPQQGVPDVLTEALFELDVFRRLQLPDGGVRHGIETNGDPVSGEVSWLNSEPAYVYAPDPWSSTVYAAAAARAAKLLQGMRPDLAELYQGSAIRAMNWSEAQRAELEAAGKDVDGMHRNVRSDRTLAAVVLYDLTGDQRWHNVFKQSAAFRTEAEISALAPGDRLQYDAAFVYARLADKSTDAALKRNAQRIIVAAAERALDYAQNNAWNLTTPDKGQPLFMTFYSEPDARELARAHFLTGDAKYLAGVVQATLFQSGANPANMTYTTGLGANPILHPLKLDSRRSGQKTPEGITVYGNFDFIGWEDWSKWVLDYYLNTATTPTVTEWPIPEAYFDIFLYPSTNEYTVDVWDKNVFVWGYLAARG